MDTNQDNLTVDALAGGTHVEPSAAGAAVSPDTFSLADLNSFLGKDFKDKDTALKALKDTQTFVGKRKEDIAAEILGRSVENKEAVPAPVESEVQSLKNKMYFLEHPELKGYESLISKLGSNPAEVVESEEFKTIFEKGKVADEVAQTRSIVSSNNRLGMPKNRMDDSIAAYNAGRTDAATTLLARGIMESYGDA